MLPITGPVRPSLSSGVPEHLTLRRPIDRERLGPGKARARKSWRLPPFQNCADDIGSQTAKPSQLRKVVQREALFRSDLDERSVTCRGDRQTSSMGIGHQPDQAFVAARRFSGLESRRGSNSIRCPQQGSSARERTIRN